MRLLFTITLVLFSLTLPQTGLAEETVKTGPHFQVILDFDNEALAEEALAVVEAIWPDGAELYGLSKARLKKPLKVYLYQQPTNYEKAEEERTQGKFKSNWAFASHADKSAHVVLQPQYPEKLIQVIGLPQATRYLLGHEAAHLICYHAWQNYRSHPNWLADGAADYLSGNALIREKKSPGLEQDPFLARYMVLTQRLIQQDKLPKVEAIFQDELSDIDRSSRYGLYLLLFRYLKDGEHSRKFSKVLAKAKGMGGGETYDKRLYKEVEKIFKKKGLAAINQGFKTYLKALTPQWDEENRSLKLTGGEWQQVSGPNATAKAFRTENKAGNHYRLKGAVKILPVRSGNHDPQMNILLDRTDTGFVSVALTQGFGVTVFDFDSRREEGDRWLKLKSHKLPKLVADKKTGFEIIVKDRMLSIAVEGHDPVEVPIEGRAMDGPWGLSAQYGSAGIWYDIQQVPEG